MTDKVMVKRESTKKQTMVYKPLHRKPKIGKTNPTKTLGVSMIGDEWQNEKRETIKWPNKNGQTKKCPSKKGQKIK